jgi:hypothetical protein
MIQRLVNQNQYHNVPESYLSVLPSNDLLSPSSTGMWGGVLFHCLLHSVVSLLIFACESRNLAIISRGMLWEMCCSLVVVYQWYFTDGPATAQWLMHMHQHYGYEGLKQ